MELSSLFTELLFILRLLILIPLPFLWALTWWMNTRRALPYHVPLDNIASLEILLVNKNYEKFQSELLRILLFYISDSFSIQKGHLSSQNIEKILRQKSIPAELVLECVDLIQYLERCKYSPHKELEVNQDLYNRVLGIVNNINKML